MLSVGCCLWFASPPRRTASASAVLGTACSIWQRRVGIGYIATAWNLDSAALLVVMCRYGANIGMADQAEPGSFTENSHAVSLSPGGTCLIWLLGNAPLQAQLLLPLTLASEFLAFSRVMLLWYVLCQGAPNMTSKFEHFHLNESRLMPRLQAHV